LFTGCKSLSNLKGYQEIDRLTTSILLIQLDFPQQRIDLLKEMELDRKANRLKQKHERHHIKLVKGFNFFKFCPHYFYYSDPEAGNLYDENLKLYDEALNLLKFRLKDDNFYVIRFTTKQFDDGLDYEELKEGLRIYKADGSAMPFGFPDFVPMTNYGAQKYYENTIKVLDKRLKMYHKEHIRFKKYNARKNKKDLKGNSKS